MILFRMTSWWRGVLMLVKLFLLLSVFQAWRLKLPRPRQMQRRKGGSGGSGGLRKRERLVICWSAARFGLYFWL